MPTVELLVGLKVPDNVAITAFHTLERMGYGSLKNLQRWDYYRFELNGDINIFKKKISQVDILVNPNKHKYDFSIEKNEKINLLVQDLENGLGLVDSLKRLGFKEIKKAEKGVLWSMQIEGKDSKKSAEEMAKELLVNENYQEYKLL